MEKMIQNQIFKFVKRCASFGRTGGKKIRLPLCGHAPRSRLRSGLWSLWWPVWDLDAELLGVLGVQALPTELHRLASDNAPDGLASEEPIEDVEADVPAGRAHRHEPAVDFVPKGEARAIAERL